MNTLFNAFTTDGEDRVAFPVKGFHEDFYEDLTKDEMCSAKPFEPKPGHWSMDFFRSRSLAQDSPTCEPDSDDESAPPTMCRNYVTQSQTGDIYRLSIRPGFTVKDVQAQLQDWLPACTLIFQDGTPRAPIWKIVPDDIDLFTMVQYRNFVLYNDDAVLPDRVSDLSYNIRFRLDAMGFSDWIRSLPIPVSTSGSGWVLPPSLSLSLATFADADAFLKTQGSSIEEFMSVYRA